MIRNFKNSIIYLVLLVFLLPTIVKFEHHHEHFVCHAKNEKHYHVAVDKCEICNFEFSISMPGIESSDLQTETPLDSYTNRYNFLSSLDFSQYSFLLRAPPIRQI